MGDPTQAQDPRTDEDAVRDAFREAMSHLAAAVVMVTTRVDGKPWGLTISSCCSVSIDPPLLLISLGKDTVSARSIKQDGAFGVSILGEQLVEAARFGALKSQPKFLERFCDPDDDLLQSCVTPVLSGALAHVDCELEQAIPVADHVIFLGRVSNVLVSAGKPLLYYARRYQRLGDWGSPEHHYLGW